MTLPDIAFASLHLLQVPLMKQMRRTFKMRRPAQTQIDFNKINLCG